MQHPKRIKHSMRSEARKEWIVGEWIAAEKITEE